MENTKEDKLTALNRRKQWMNLAMLGAAFVLTCFAIITGSYVNDTEVVEVGDIAGRKYVASRSVENTLATDKLKQAAADEVGPLYTLDPLIEQTALENINEYFENLDRALSEMEAAASRAYVNALDEEDGVEEAALELDFELNIVPKLPVAITPQQAKLYYELTVTGKSQFKDEITDIVLAAYEQRITDENMDRIVTVTEENINQLLWQDNLRELAGNIAVASLEPNLKIDEEAMEAAKEQRVALVEPVMILKDQKIVDEGELVTEEIYYVLDELGLINISYTSSVLPFVGSIVIVFMGFIIVAVYLATQQKKFLLERNKTLVIFTVYTLSLVILGVMSNIKSYYFIPVSLFAMLIGLLTRTKLALVLNCFVSLFALFIFNGEADFLVYALITGSFSALLIQYTNKRTQMILVYGAVGLIHMISYIGVNMFFMKDFSALVLRESLYAAAVGVITIIVVVGSLPLWESLFGIDTQYKLLELSNPNNEIMKRLMIEAPGTYHHSLVVANLAETAAYDIYANGALARVGAYYHDIGKLKQPSCFSENQFGENIHNKLNPFISAKMIIDHVNDGADMARKSKVPKAVRDIIEQHHGTTLVKYFYFKATQEETVMDIEEQDFRYKGPIPQTKESAIVMLADTVEAAVRSSLGEQKSIEDVSKLIDALFKDKLEDGQLNDCRLDLKELQVIKQSFMKVFNGMYHDRIAYPKAEEIEAVRRQQQSGKEIPPEQKEEEQ